VFDLANSLDIRARAFGQALSFEANGYITRGVILNAVGTSVDSEALVLLNYQDSPADPMAGVCLRLQEDNTAYLIYVRLASAVQRIEIRLADNTIIQTPFSNTNGLRYYVRARVTGSVDPLIQVKAWLYTDAEPAGWLLEHTDTTAGRITTAGTMGWISGSSGYGRRIDFYMGGFGTDGDVAPIAAATAPTLSNIATSAITATSADVSVDLVF